MKPKLIALNLILVGALGATVWQARLHWMAAQAERRATLNVTIPSTTPAPAPPVAKPQPPAAVQYVDVAEKNLFSVDRNPAIVIDPPKPVEVKKMPALPVVYGTMGLPSGTKAIMAAHPGESSRSVSAGDTIGDFKVIALDSQNITFEWDDRKIEKKIDDLIDRSNPKGAASGPAVAANNPSSGGLQPPPPPPPTTGDPIGTKLTETMMACRPGENSPAGTVQGGFKKVITYSPFGATCRWMKQ